jgi:hypothetical protein
MIDIKDKIMDAKEMYLILMGSKDIEENVIHSQSIGKKKQWHQPNERGWISATVKNGWQKRLMNLDKKCKF